MLFAQSGTCLYCSLLAGELSAYALPLKDSVRTVKSMSCAEGHEHMGERQPSKIDAICVLLLALFLVGLAGYSVAIRFLK